MLNEATKKQLAERAGCSLAELNRAIGAETEETLSFDTEGEFITHTDLDAIKERAGQSAKRRWEEGLIKEIRNEEALEFEGKTKENLLKALKEKYTKEQAKEPNTRITELEEDKKKLQQSLIDAEKKLTDETEKFNSQLTQSEIDAIIKSTLPEKTASGLTRELLHKLYKVEREFTKTADGIALINPATKEVIKDKKLNPVSIADDLKSFMEQFGEGKDEGRGGGDGGKGKTNIEKFTKRSEVDEYFEKNKTPLSEQAGVLSKAMKNEGFKMTE